MIGDGDPREWGRRLRDGREVVHPPWGPTEIRGDTAIEIKPIGFGWYYVTVSFLADRFGGHWLLTGRRFGRRRAERLAGLLDARAREVIAAREVDQPGWREEWRA